MLGCLGAQIGGMCLGDRWRALVASDDYNTPAARAWAAEYESRTPRLRYADKVYLTRRSVCNLLYSRGWLDDDVSCPGQSYTRALFTAAMCYTFR